MDLCISFSSTVCMEAMYYNIPIGIISDFGIRKDLDSQYFIGSNLFIELSDFKKNVISNCRINEKWKKEHLYFDLSRDKNLNDAITKFFLSR